MAQRTKKTATVADWKEGIEFGDMADLIQVVDIRTASQPNQTYAGGGRIVADSVRNGGPASGVELRVGDLYPAPRGGDWVRFERDDDLDDADDLTVWFQTYSDEEPLPVIGNRTTVNPASVPEPLGVVISGQDSRLEADTLQRAKDISIEPEIGTISSGEKATEGVFEGGYGDDIVDVGVTLLPANSSGTVYTGPIKMSIFERDGVSNKPGVIIRASATGEVLEVGENEEGAPIAAAMLQRKTQSVIASFILDQVFRVETDTAVSEDMIVSLIVRTA